MSSQDFPYFQKSKKILHSHWLRAVSIHLKSVSIWGLYRYRFLVQTAHYHRKYVLVLYPDAIKLLVMLSTALTLDILEDRGWDIEKTQ